MVASWSSGHRFTFSCHLELFYCLCCTPWAKNGNKKVSFLLQSSKLPFKQYFFANSFDGLGIGTFLDWPKSALSVSLSHSSLTQRQRTFFLNRHIHRMDGSSTGWFIEWTIHWLDDSSNGRFIEWIIHRMDNSLNGRIVEWTIHHME